MNFSVRVEYECTPIRHIAVQCPKCKKWFHGTDITHDDLRYSYQIDMANYWCPVCDTKFGYDNKRNPFSEKDKPCIEEVSQPEVYDGCLTQKVIWE